MRRLSMKNKRRKSEMSDNSSEENGVARATADEDDEMKKGKENENADTPRKGTMKKRTSRSRHSLKATSDDSALQAEEEDTQAMDTEEENKNVGKGGASKRLKKEDHKASSSIKDKENNQKEYEARTNSTAIVREPFSVAARRRSLRQLLSRQLVNPDVDGSNNSILKSSGGLRFAKYRSICEVEKIVGQRTIKGRRQFLVRWKGYDDDSDTWEQEKDLNCPQLIEEFLVEDEENQEEKVKPENSPRVVKAKSPKMEKKSRKLKNNKEITSDGKHDKEDQKEFEVEKIIEVRFKKNKTRQFLIRWKGFTSVDDTWEPEENLNCPELIEKFMQKVEKAKTADVRELRANRPHTKRYTLATHETGRRLSRRNMDKQRAMYHECDE